MSPKRQRQSSPVLNARSFPRKDEVFAYIGLNQTLHDLQEYLAHKKTPTPLGTPEDPGHWPTAGS
jgi:hypothetical protein